MQTVTLAITNVDENAPTFTDETLAYQEDQNAGAVVGTVTTASDDVGVTGFIFQATGNQTSSDGYYQINDSGVITITAAGVAAEANDFESAPNSFAHVVTVEDAVGNTTRRRSR